MASVFNAESTTDDVLQGVDLSGKRILVTGVSAGLGVETARSLVAHGAHVVGTARDLTKARAATVGITGLEVLELDLASLASVRAAADGLVAKGERFDVVIANAGVMACPKSVTKDGFETQFGTNHLGHFVLINRIAQLLREGGRVVSLSSSGHRFADVDLEDPNFEHAPYDAFTAYGRSKTANVLFAVEFDRRHKAAGVRAAAVHPGGIQTELARHLTPTALQQLLASFEASRAPGVASLSWKNISQGAATSVWAAVTDGETVGGKYCEDCAVAEVREDSSLLTGGVRGYALDGERAKALWAKSEELVGEKFSFV